MIRQSCRKRIQGAAQTLHLIGCHAAGDIESKYDCQRTGLTAAMLHLKKRKRLLDVVEVQFEIFLPKIPNRPAFYIGCHDIERNQIGVDLQDFIRLFFPREYLSRALRPAIGFLGSAW
jgi:hypothetical protein